MSRVSVLAHIGTDDMTVVPRTNGSTEDLGTELQQIVNDAAQLLSVFSLKLLWTRSRCSTFGREILRLHLAIIRSWHMLEGRN